MTTEATIPTNRHEAFNAIIHLALRRDLDRLADAVAAPLDGRRRAAIGRHMRWVLDFLHHHHTAEDEGVWPAVLAKNPGAIELFEAMESEHEALAAAADALADAVDRLVEDGSEAIRASVGEAVAEMQAVMVPHLDHEETVAMPVVVATLDKTDWKRIDREHFRNGMSFADSTYELFWTLDGLDPARTALMRRWVTPPLLWVLDRTRGRHYRAEARRCWG